MAVSDPDQTSGSYHFETSFEPQVLFQTSYSPDSDQFQTFFKLSLLLSLLQTSFKPVLYHFQTLIPLQTFFRPILDFWANHHRSTVPLKLGSHMQLGSLISNLRSDLASDVVLRLQRPQRLPKTSHTFIALVDAGIQGHCPLVNASDCNLNKRNHNSVV